MLDVYHLWTRMKVSLRLVWQHSLSCYGYSYIESFTWNYDEAAGSARKTWPGSLSRWCTDWNGENTPELRSCLKVCSLMFWYRFVSELTSAVSCSWKDRWRSLLTSWRGEGCPGSPPGGSPSPRPRYTVRPNRTGTAAAPRNTHGDLTYGHLLKNVVCRIFFTFIDLFFLYVMR